MSVRNSAADLRQQVVGRHGGEVERVALCSGHVCAEPGEAECPALLNAEGVGDREDVRGLRGAGLCSPVVDRVPVHLAALGQPRFGLALLVQGGLDQFEERACGGIVGHVFIFTELTRVKAPVTVSICAQSRIELPRDAQRKEGVGDVYLSSAQACGRLNISRATLAKRIRDGELKAFKGQARNSHVKVSLASIEEYEKRREIARSAA